MAFAKQACARVQEPVNTPEKIVKYMQEKYGCQPQEYFVAIAMDVRMVPLAVIEVGIGGMTQATVDPKILFSGVLLAGASAFIIFHNHPSGDPEPSQQDIDLTRQLQAGGKLLTLQLVDHIVLGAGDKYVIFSQRGLLGR